MRTTKKGTTFEGLGKLHSSSTYGFFAACSSQVLPNPKVQVPKSQAPNHHADRSAKMAKIHYLPARTLQKWSRTPDSSRSCVPRLCGSRTRKVIQPKTVRNEGINSGTLCSLRQKSLQRIETTSDKDMRRSCPSAAQCNLGIRLSDLSLFQAGFRV